MLQALQGRERVGESKREREREIGKKPNKEKVLIKDTSYKNKLKS